MSPDRAAYDTYPVRHKLLFCIFPAVRLVFSSSPPDQLDLISFDQVRSPPPSLLECRFLRGQSTNLIWKRMFFPCLPENFGTHDVQTLHNSFNAANLVWLLGILPSVVHFQTLCLQPRWVCQLEARGRLRTSSISRATYVASSPSLHSLFKVRGKAASPPRTWEPWNPAECERVLPPSVTPRTA